MSLAIELCRKTNTHEEWLALIAFGMPTLIKDQEVLMECIFFEAEREAARVKGAKFGPLWVSRVMADANLCVFQYAKFRPSS